MTAAARLAVLAVLLAPQVAAARCAPAARGVFPAAGIVGAQLDAVVDGEGLAGATVDVFGDPGLGVAVQATGDLAVSLRLTIDAATQPGERILVLTTAGGATAVSFTVNPPGGPIVADVSPPLVATQGVPLDVTVTGTGLAGISPATIAVSGHGVVAGAVAAAPDGASLAVRFDVDAAADVGTHAVTLGNGVGTAVVTLYVQRPSPVAARVLPAAVEAGATVPLRIVGAHLTGAALVVTDEGVTIRDVVTPDDATLTATLDVDAAAPTSTGEARLLVVTTESGQTTIELFVVPAGLPSVTVVDPGAAEPGETVRATLRGLNLTGGVVSSGSPDVALANAVVIDDETLAVDVAVAPAAATNVDQPLTVVTAHGEVEVPFRVIPPGQPFFNAARPPFGNRGSLVTVRFDGVNLGPLLAGSGVQLSGPKIAESNARALDDGTVEALLDIDPTAAVGLRDVTLTTTAGSFTRSAAFRVNVPGQVPTITDVVPGLVEPGATTAVTVSGANFAGAGVVVTGPGVTVANVIVDPSGTALAFDLTVAADAPAETRGVLVVTASGIARCTLTSAAPEPPLVAAKLVKSGAVFTVDSSAFRLFVFEFSIDDRFVPGPRTVGIPDAVGTLVLGRREPVAIEQAFRDRHRGVVRVRAVTATNVVAVSAGQVLRR